MIKIYSHLHFYLGNYCYISFKININFIENGSVNKLKWFLSRKLLIYNRRIVKY